VNPRPRWEVRLGCGHTRRHDGYQPRERTWMSCGQAGCRRQAEILRVTPVLAVMVQDPLFDRDEIAA